MSYRTSLLLLLWGPTTLLLLPESLWVAALLLSLMLVSYGLLWHQLQLARLEHWLEDPSQHPHPTPYLIWGSIIHKIETIHEKNRARKRKLRRMLQGFRESSNALPDATVILGSERQLEWCNATSMTLLGIHPIRDYDCDITKRLQIPELSNYLARGDFRQPFQIPAPIAPSLHLEIRIVPYGKGKQLLQARDITRLVQLETIRRDFVANVSHEMRTPLTVIHGYLESLTDAVEAGELRPWRVALVAMNDQSRRLVTIVEDLLLLSRVESLDSPLSQDQIDVPTLLESLVTTARRFSGSHQHHIELVIESALQLYGNLAELTSAFTNLIYNAIHYTPDGGHIRVRWYDTAEGPCLSVEDNGIGIAKEHLPRLKERFYRVNVGRSRASGGTGLGLAIANHILARHHARLLIKSTPGEGSTFSCHFPPVVINHSEHSPQAVCA